MVSVLCLSTNRLAFFIRVFRRLSAISATTRPKAADHAASVSPASSEARFFLRRHVVHHGHLCRLLRAYIFHVVVAAQELIIQRYLLPVLQIHSSDDRFHFVVETSNDVSDSVCRRLWSEGLQQPRVHQDHFNVVLHLL